MRFEFATATRILFGPGTLREVAPLASGLGRRALLVTGRDASRAGVLRESLVASDLEVTDVAVAGEPDLACVEAGVAAGRSAQCELVLAMGGGSAIDAGKAMAALLANPGGVLDYLEVIGKGQALEHPSLPFIAIATTSGTGAEVTRNAVLASPEHRVKASLRSPHMLPRVAVVDPDLTLDLPRDITAATGMDALTQLIEPFVSARANPLTQGLCREGITRVVRSLPRACAYGHDREAREDMSLGSLLGGLALANAGLGAVHGFAAPIGGMFPAPHGAVCAALLPHVMRANLKALQERAPAAPALRAYEELGPMLTGHPRALASDGVQWVADLCRDLAIPGLGRYGIGEPDVDPLVEKAMAASSMKANPLPLTREELAGVLREAL